MDEAMKTAKIVLIDDDYINNKILRNVLNNIGYQNIETFTSAKKALDYLVNCSNQELPESLIDVIITDLMMPEIDGAVLCRTIKQIKVFEHTPIIMITASNFQEDLERAFDAGVMDYITKPIRSAEVILRINAALKLKYAMDHRINSEKDLKKELKIAEKLQRSLLPLQVLQDDIKIYGEYIPQGYLGGDLYYWSSLDDHKYGVILIDVMGHGTSTALICMYIRALLPSLFHENLDIKIIISKIDSYMKEFNTTIRDDIDYYMTAISLIIDTTNRKIEYVNAGHVTGYLIDKNSKINRLESNCLPLGIPFENVVEKNVINYYPSSSLIIFTDGLTGNDGKGVDTFEKELQSCWLNNKKTVNLDLSKKIIELNRNEIKEDDMSIVLIDLP